MPDDDIQALLDKVADGLETMLQNSPDQHLVLVLRFIQDLLEMPVEEREAIIQLATKVNGDKAALLNGVLNASSDSWQFMLLGLVLVEGKSLEDIIRLAAGASSGNPEGKQPRADRSGPTFRRPGRGQRSEGPQTQAQGDQPSSEGPQADQQRHGRTRPRR